MIEDAGAWITKHSSSSDGIIIENDANDTGRRDRAKSGDNRKAFVTIVKKGFCCQNKIERS